MPGTERTYAPRSPDLSSVSRPSTTLTASPAASYHAPQAQGYTPRSPKISPDTESERSERTHSLHDRRTSYVPPTLANYASQSPEVVNFQRRHSAYIPPSDLASLNTTYTGTGSTYHSPVSYRQQSAFTNSPSTQQGYRSSYSIPQSALTYQPPIPIKQEGRAHTLPNDLKPPYLPDPNFSQHTTPEHKMELDTNVKTETKLENGGMEDFKSLGASRGIEVKTKFPVARIKRIMQADEEVGKVAQVTPVVVSKALELFMISLVSKSAALARSGNSKRVTAIHLKKAIEADEQFDFLSDVVAKVAEGPDAGQGQDKGKRGKSEEGSESEEKPRKKGRGRKKD